MQSNTNICSTPSNMQCDIISWLQLVQFLSNKLNYFFLAAMCDSIDIGEAAKKKSISTHSYAFVQLIVAMSDIPPFMPSFLYPLIAMKTDKDELSHIHYVEDTLETWLIVIQNTRTLTRELLELSRDLLPFIGEHSSIESDSIPFLTFFHYPELTVENILMDPSFYWAVQTRMKYIVKRNASCNQRSKI